MGKYYIYAVAPLLEDALMDRDLVHRQTAASVVQHDRPHVVQVTTAAIDGCHVALGPAVILNYLLQGLFHRAWQGQEVYWRQYNNLCIGGQDDSIAQYPKMGDEGVNAYRRHELDVFI